MNRVIVTNIPRDLADLLDQEGLGAEGYEALTIEELITNVVIQLAEGGVAWLLIEATKSQKERFHAVVKNWQSKRELKGQKLTVRSREEVVEEEDLDSLALDRLIELLDEYESGSEESE